MSDPLGETDREYHNDRSGVERLSIVMMQKLRKNRHKAHWNTVSQAWLLGRLKDEVEELQLALQEGWDVISECADVANFAMMIADNEMNKEHTHAHMPEKDRYNLGLREINT